MRKLRVSVIDLVSKGPVNTLWSRIMYPNLASIMPQAIATWCSEEGHEVTITCYTGSEDLSKEIPSNVDLLFICSFTQAALLAYSLSNFFRSRESLLCWAAHTRAAIPMMPCTISIMYVDLQTNPLSRTF